ncbi:MAG: NMD3-related protein [Candidatus Hodarchaeales archaeon]
MVSQCIVCGSDKIFFERLCQRCYLENHPIVKQKNELQITICERCELLFIKNHWTNFYLTDVGKPSLNPRIAAFIMQEWSFHYKPKKIDIETMSYESGEFDYSSSITGIVNISVQPDPFVPLLSVSEDFKIHINWGECSDCRTRLTGTYSSKIQIRSPNKLNISQLEEWGNEIEELSNSYPLSDGKSPLFKIIHLKNGIDALFQSKSPANSIGRVFSKNHGGIVSVTTEFAGFDKSKWKEYPRKPVVLISLPEFDPDDFVFLNEKSIQIYRFKDAKVEYWDFNKKIKEKMPIKSFIEAKPKRIEGDIHQFQVINYEQKEKFAQIMNIDNFETLYVDAIDIDGLKEGEIFRGTFYQGKILVKQQLS